MRIKWVVIYLIGLMLLLSMSTTLTRSSIPKVDASGQGDQTSASSSDPDDRIRDNASRMITEGRRTFRFDTFGDEAFWGDTLQLHKAIEGANLGGVGPGISPQVALDLGLKVDVDALPEALVNQLKQGKVNLDDPATTLALLKLNGVLGIKGTFQGNTLSSIGLTCAVCHSTVDNSLTFGIGHRLDGWANRDLDIGKIVASAPDLSAFATLLGVSQDTVRQV